MKKLTPVLCFLVLVLSFFLGTNFSKNPYVDALDSTCSIYVTTNQVDEESIIKGEMKFKEAFATGVVVAETKDEYLVLTAGHVVHNALDGKCIVNFPTSKIVAIGHVIYSDFVYTEDNLKARIPGDDIGFIGIPKCVGPLTVQQIDLDRPKDVFTVGCSKGEYPSVVLSNVIKFMPGSFRMHFSPNQGRSGSGVFSSKGLVGIVLTVDGGCQNAEKIKNALDCVAPDVDKSRFWHIIGIKYHEGSTTSLLLLLQCSLLPKGFLYSGN